MYVRNFDGTITELTKDELEGHLSSIRIPDVADGADGADGADSAFGAFVLSHSKDGPSLWILTTEGMAYLHYYPDPDFLMHAGYHAEGMTPASCSEPISFMTPAALTDEDDEHEEYLVVECDKIISFSDALLAAKEFFDDERLPDSIQWVEL